MGKKLLFLTILLCSSFSLWSQEVKREIILFNNEDLTITREEVMYNWSEGLPGSRAYNNAIIVFYNKTNNKIRVKYKVEATIYRYNIDYSYENTVFIEPNRVESDFVISHYEDWYDYNQSVVGAHFTLINYAVEPREYKTSW